LEDRTINIMSFSKTFSMTGYRLGYIIVPDRYLETANAVAGMVAARPTTFVYAGGLAALKGDMTYVEERRKEYGKRKEFFCNALDNINGIGCQSSEGAFYAWFNIKELGLTSDEFCSRLLEEENVNVRSGSRFGVNVEGYVRAALVRPMDELREAARRIANFTGAL
jgi:aspartate/methionine/tyrosine aminotransferase